MSLWEEYKRSRRGEDAIGRDFFWRVLEDVVNVVLVLVDGGLVVVVDLLVGLETTGVGVEVGGGKDGGGKDGGGSESSIKSSSDSTYSPSIVGIINLIYG